MNKNLLLCIAVFILFISCLTGFKTIEVYSTEYNYHKPGDRIVMNFASNFIKSYKKFKPNTGWKTYDVYNYLALICNYDYDDPIIAVSVSECVITFPSGNKINMLNKDIDVIYYPVNKNKDPQVILNAPVLKKNNKNTLVLNNFKDAESCFYNISIIFKNIEIQFDDVDSFEIKITYVVTRESEEMEKKDHTAYYTKEKVEAYRNPFTV